MLAMSLELEIGQLRLTFTGGTFTAERASDVGRRAMSHLQALIQTNQHQLELSDGGVRLAQATTDEVRADLGVSNNDELARLVAREIYRALIEQLRI